MMDALEKPVKEDNGKIFLTGDYVCHEDIPDKSPLTLDEHFTVCGEEGGPSYVVLIKKIDP